MRIFGIAGWSGSGKTTLLVKLIPVLVRRGVAVATLKHTHHTPDLGDDESRSLCAAGCRQVLAASPERFALMGTADDRPDGLDQLAARMRDVDLLLVEGFKFATHERLEVWTPATGKTPLADDLSTVVAVATDSNRCFSGLPVFRRDEVEAIADFIISRKK